MPILFSCHIICYIKSMFIIGEALVQRPVTDTEFSCDLDSCKGACCTMRGGRGAPLLDEEIDQIRNALPFALKYLNNKHRTYIEKFGFFEGNSGDYTTKCIHNKACVFVYYQNGIARCSLERAFEGGYTTWKKPISCHLFPVRISNGTPATVYYEKIDECNAGVKKGEQEKLPLVEFLEEPLRRRFGDDWYLYLLIHVNGEVK